MASRAKLLLVFFLFLGPLCAAFIWYYGLGATLVPKSQSNNAPLIAPVVSLTTFENDSHFSDVVNFSSLQKKWTIVHLLESNCDETCKQALYNTRQTRIALGKDSHRIQRIIILSDSKFAKEVEYNHEDAFILKPQTNGLEQQLQPIIHTRSRRCPGVDHRRSVSARMLRCDSVPEECNER